MASVKVRSRRDGAAIPLDETDKQLLNLMQGQFALVERPFAHVAELAGLAEDEVMTRVQHLLDKRIIREITPIFDTRALGYSSMLVAAKVDAEYPHRAAQIINTHPGVTHNYLRNHDFNLWFTIATEPGSKLGLSGTLEVLQRLTGAESVRELPTLKLFKIRMDLEMAKGTDALSTAGEAVEPLELEPIELSEDDIATIRATQGKMQVVSEPYAAAAERLGTTQADVLAAPRVAQGARRPPPRRGDPLPPPRRLLGQRHGRVERPRRAGSSRSGAGWRPTAASRTATSGPTYKDWPYSIFTMAHGRSKEECDAILASIAAETGIEDRATLYSSTEFKKVRMLYFTDDFRRWEEEHA